jgi:hypothetical protein
LFNGPYCSSLYASCFPFDSIPCCNSSAVCARHASSPSCGNGTLSTNRCVNADLPLRCPIGVASVTRAPPVALDNYTQGDWRLGPVRSDVEQRAPSLLPFIQGWAPYQDEQSFFKCFWNENGNRSGWFFPILDGFVLVGGVPVKRNSTLPIGTFVDQFGSGLGSYLSPRGSSFASRAIPPTNMNTYTSTIPFSYTYYEVTAPVNVEEGPIAPYFQVSGLGLQYYLGALNIPKLIMSGQLRFVGTANKKRDLITTPKTVDAPKTVEALVDALRVLEVTAFEIVGRVQVSPVQLDAYLSLDTRDWSVTLVERGSRRVQQVFNNEEDACADMYAQLSVYSH